LLALKIGFLGRFAALLELPAVVELFVVWAIATEETKSSDKTIESIFFIWSFFFSEDGKAARGITALLEKRAYHTNSRE
jgi:hypothetical protein